jgi:hypothetical protein
MYNGENLEGATPLDLDEAAGLKPDLTTRAELNSFEQANIAQGIRWARKSTKLKRSLLTIDSLKLLHRQMFGDTPNQFCQACLTSSQQMMYENYKGLSVL